MKMAEKKKPEEKSEGMAEGVLRELGFGGLIDSALKLPVFQQRFREVDKGIEERLSRESTSERVSLSPRFGLRPHVESSYSVRHVREETGREWRPTIRKPIRKPVQKIVAEGPEEIEPLVDVFDEGDHLRVVAELPGVWEGSIKAEVKGGKLTISADAPDRKYRREAPLPLVVEAEPTELTYKNGVLEIGLKKK